MTHKKALKKLMGIDFDRNTANKLLRNGTACGHTNAWVVDWQMNVNAIIQRGVITYKAACDFYANWISEWNPPYANRLRIKP